jgi:hypothetical protein
MKEVKKDRNFEKNRIEILEIKSPISHLKYPLKALLIEQNKLKVEYQELKIK